MVTTLQKDYKERIVPALEKQFNYSTVMRVPRLEKIVINQGIGEATQDKKLLDTAIAPVRKQSLLSRARISRTSSSVRKCRSASV